jgi:APA family basic amino acid/polyamine antiporter
MWIEFVFRNSIVCVIYVWQSDVSRRSAVARNCYRPSDRIGVVSVYFLSCRDVNHCSDDYDFDFVCTTDDYGWCQSVLYNGARRSFFKKAAQLNKASVPAWSIWAQCFGLRLCV